ncbi:MAG TPA: glycosyltransferase [Candidatus Obscuribacterales bacterium]
MKLVSVIIATFNRPERLVKALASVAAQTIGRDNVEVVVVNDGGPSVASLIEAERARLGMTIKLRELAQTGGVSHARNVAIDLTEGKYLAFLDDDDLFGPEHLVAGVEPMERGEAGFVYLGAVVSDHWLETIPADVSGYPLKAYPYSRQMLQVANYLHTGSVIVRNFKDTSIRFDERLEVCEDWDMWIALTGIYKGMFVDKITCVYHQVKGFQGLVSTGATTNKFAFATEHIQAKWPSDDPVVIASRAWMSHMEEYRCGLVRDGRPVNFFFDDVLKYLYSRISRQQLPDRADIPGFFA